MKRTCLAALVLLLVACGSRGWRWDVPDGSLGPASDGAGLVYVNVPQGTLVRLDPATGKVASAQVSYHARALATVPGLALVVGGDGAAPVLDVVRLPSLERRRIRLPAAYDRVVVSPDGASAVLFHDPDRPPPPGGPAARNHNEVAIVDVAAGRAMAVALETSSIAPGSVIFSPDGELAAVILDAAIALLDRRDPARRVTVPLTLTSGTTLPPEEAVFSPDGAFLYVRSTRSPDVLVIELVRGEGELGGTVNFLSQPGATRVRDLLVPAGEAFGRHVAAVFSRGTGSTRALLDAGGDGSATHAVEIAAQVDGLLDLGDGLLLAHASAGSALAAWDPLEDRVANAQLAGSQRLAPASVPGTSFLIHGTDRGAALTAATARREGARVRLDLRPIVLGGTPVASAADPDSGRLLVALEIAGEESGELEDEYDYEYEEEEPVSEGAVVTVDAATLALGGATLDAVPSGAGRVGSFFHLPHAGSLGDVTVVPVSDVRRERMTRFVGFLLAGAIEGKR